ncbi:MAG: hypothetical protein F4Y79_11615 [Gemmatimonadetes bacterium]|nr:hypothetical protein [Gemmatimonadota bacterium]MYF18056.1 hypothetical protein [Gemmatimonadota bacterium]
MKQFFALYVKELKAHKVLFLFVLLLIAGMNVYGLLKMANISQEQIVAQEQLGIILKFVLFVMLPINLAKSILVLSLPFLLAHIFNSEWQSETHYQMFALPVPQYTVVLAKVAAVASIGFVGGGIVIGCVYLSMAKVADWLVDVGSVFAVERMPFFDFAFIASLMLVTYMIFIFGVVIGMVGVKFSVKRYRRLAAIASFVVFLSFSLFALQGLSVFASFLMPMLPFSHNIGLISIETSVTPYFSIILTGIIFMILGVVMYEKRAEI